MTQTNNKTVIDKMFEVIYKKEINSDNPFWEIGFDGDAPRLGWVLPPAIEEIEKILRHFFELNSIKNKDTFIFSGMGGSINTIKAVECILNSNSKSKIICIDSLDPASIKDVNEKVADWSKTVVIGISKSGTTRETLSILNTFKEKFESEEIDYKDHFLWLIDLANQEKVETSGWKGVDFMPIQVDKETDIGGRFTAPHTLIFLIPLIILLNNDFDKLKELWGEYLNLRDRMVGIAEEIGEDLAQSQQQYFTIETDHLLAKALETWIIQLFHESLGSKIEGFDSKAIVTIPEEKPNGFSTIKFDINTKHPIIKAMLYMYLCEIVVSTISVEKHINFVIQPEVEIYKKKMKEVSLDSIPEAEKIDFEVLKTKIDSILNQKTRFIEAVCYWHLTETERQEIKNKLRQLFPRLDVLIFAGSDWNHHSYQAASKNQDTAFLILTKEKYLTEVTGFKTSTLEENTKILQAIAYATYLTLLGKAGYFSLVK